MQRSGTIEAIEQLEGELSSKKVNLLPQNLIRHEVGLAFIHCRGLEISVVGWEAHY
jgi:hypothetical protein